MEKESDYLVRNAKLVLGYLNDLYKKKCIVSAHFGENNRSFMTTIVNLDPKKQLIELECARDSETNQELLHSHKVLFRTEFEGVKVSFAGKRIRQITQDGEKIFVMPIPDSIFWMQRRSCYRAKIPAAHTHCYCQFIVELEQHEEDAVIKIPTVSRFKVSDISISGFSFLNVNPSFADYMLPPREYHNVILHLHDDGDNEARVAFEITNVNKIRSGRAIVAQRVGCHFLELPIGFDTVIQKYVQDIDLQQRLADS